MKFVADCVPGAKVEEGVPPATYRGKIRLKIGPMTVDYRSEAGSGSIRIRAGRPSR